MKNQINHFFKKKQLWCFYSEFWYLNEHIPDVSSLFCLLQFCYFYTDGATHLYSLLLIINCVERVQHSGFPIHLVSYAFSWFLIGFCFFSNSTFCAAPILFTHDDGLHQQWFRARWQLRPLQAPRCRWVPSQCQQQQFVADPCDHRWTCGGCLCWRHGSLLEAQEEWKEEGEEAKTPTSSCQHAATAAIDDAKRINDVNVSPSGMVWGGKVKGTFFYFLFN